MEPFSAVEFLGALAVFIYGIRLSRIGVQLFAGNRLQSLISSLTDNRFAGLGVGVIVTLILQSSTATTVMLVSFAATGAITLPQAMGVILGSDIGTALVVILLSVKKISEIALLILVVGVALDILSQRKRTRYLSMMLLGFGFVFFGMHLMILATSPLRGNHLLVEIFEALAQNPAYAFCAAVVFTALVQNSATTLGLCIALAFSNLISLPDAVPLVLGANVGTCASSLLNSFGGGTSARRVALSHLLFKLSGAIIAMFFLVPITKLLADFFSYSSALGTNPAAQIAFTHVGFNLCLSILFLPFINQGAWLVRKLVPEPFHSGEEIFGPKYLDPKSLETPALAFANARREILRMAEIGLEMFVKTIAVFERDDHDLLSYVEEQDDKVDILDRATKFFLAKISQETLTSEQARMQLNLVAITSDLEEICDVVNKNVLELAEKKIQKGRHFSIDGWNEIKDVHAKIVENYGLMLSSLTSKDETIARKVMRHEKHLAVLEDRYREAHLLRLHKGLKETIETSSIHLDLLANFRRINSKLTAIVRTTIPVSESRGR